MSLCAFSRSRTAVQFGISTQLYHAQRLRRDHLAEVASFGFRAVEIIATPSHVDYHDGTALDDLADWLTREGLCLHSVHAPVMARFEAGRWVGPLSNASPDESIRAHAVLETRAALELARRVPFGTLIVHVGLQDALLAKPADNDRGAALRSIEEIAACAGPLGVRVALEVIPNALSTADELAAMVDALGMPGVGTCLDIGHARLMGGVADAIETLSETLIATHVHDNHGARDEHLPPFEGSIDWPGALIALRKIGYEGTMMLELASAAETAPALARARQAVARLETAARSC
jgi:sugar phosphate isomerase/epimerase